jgi:hypothetical protein
VITREVIYQIHELNLEDRSTGFLAKSKLSNWANHVSGFGSTFMKIWTCGSFPRIVSRNASTRLKNFFNGVIYLSSKGTNYQRGLLITSAGSIE